MNLANLIKVVQKEFSGEKQASIAAEFGISEAYVSRILSGQQPPCKAMLDALGIERRVIYVRMSK